MKLKNREVRDMAFAIEALGNRTSDVKLRFDLAKKTKMLMEENKQIDKSVNDIIKERNKKDNSVTSINIFDDEYENEDIIYDIPRKYMGDAKEIEHNIDFNYK